MTLEDEGQVAQPDHLIDEATDPGEGKEEQQGGEEEAGREAPAAPRARPPAVAPAVWLVMRQSVQRAGRRGAISCAVSVSERRLRHLRH